MAQADVAELLPVITPFSVPIDSTMTILYGVAHEQAIRDAPSASGYTLTLAETYYVAHMLAMHAGKTGVQSEKIDDYAISFTPGGQSAAYLDRYYGAIADANAGTAITAATLAVELTRDDSLENFDLDAAGILDESDTGDEFT